LRVFVGREQLVLQALEAGGAGCMAALANARADVLLRVRDERSDPAQQAVDQAHTELSGITALKRAVGERLAERGATYPAGSRAPIGV
jgi:hypothetical protein